MTAWPSLTGDRRRFGEALTLEWNRAIRNRHPLALLLIDIDYFKMQHDFLRNGTQ